MKIAVLSHLKFPIGQPFAGGLERHTHLLVRTLRARGHAVTLFAAEGSDPDLRAIIICPPTGEASGDPVRDARIDAIETAAYRVIMEAVASGGFDLVHNNCLHDLPLRLSRRIAAPMATVLHTPPFEPFVGGVRDIAGRSPLVAVSDALARDWRSIAPRLEVIGNGVNLMDFPFRARPSHEPYAIWSGRIVPEKGLHLAIDAARLAGIELRFAGPRSPARYWADEIESRLGPGVVDLGHLGQADLAAALGGARIAVATPRWEEPFGLVIAEALACGTPVAGFRRGAFPDLLDAATGRLAAPDDVADLARVMSEALSLDRGACRRRAEAHFDVEVMIDRYEALYGTLVAHSTRRSALASVHADA